MDLSLTGSKREPVRGDGLLLEDGVPRETCCCPETLPSFSGMFCMVNIFVRFTTGDNENAGLDGLWFNPVHGSNL